MFAGHRTVQPFRKDWRTTVFDTEDAVAMLSRKRRSQDWGAGISVGERFEKTDQIGFLRGGQLEVAYLAIVGDRGRIGVVIGRLGPMGRLKGRPTRGVLNIVGNFRRRRKWDCIPQADIPG